MKHNCGKRRRERSPWKVSSYPVANGGGGGKPAQRVFWRLGAATGLPLSPRALWPRGTGLAACGETGLVVGSSPQLLQGWKNPVSPPGGFLIEQKHLWCALLAAGREAGPGLPWLSHRPAPAAGRVRPSFSDGGGGVGNGTGTRLPLAGW